MGLQDRQYYQDDERSWNIGFGGGMRTGGTGVGSYSAVMLILIANVVIFFLDAFSPSLAPGIHWLSHNLALDTTAPWKIWTFVTYGFAHASIDSGSGFWHIGTNMLVLFLFGRDVESRLGRTEFFKFYFIAILVSAAAFFLSSILTQSVASCVGASGAVSAVLMLFIFWYPKKTLYLWLVIPIPAWLVGVFLVLGDVSRAFAPNSNIAWEATWAGPHSPPHTIC